MPGDKKRESAFRALDEAEQLSQARSRMCYVAADLYARLSRWFVEDCQKTFLVSCHDASATAFSWGASAHCSRSAYKRWIPDDDSRIDDIADVVGAGAFDIDEMAQRFVEEPFSGFEMERARDIEKVYEAAAASYEGPMFERPPALGSWQKHLSWFEECRSAIEVEEPLAALAAGTPIGELVEEKEAPSPEELAALAFARMAAGDHDLMWHFPNMKREEWESRKWFDRFKSVV